MKQVTIDELLQSGTMLTSEQGSVLIVNVRELRFGDAKFLLRPYVVTFLWSSLSFTRQFSFNFDRASSAVKYATSLLKLSTFDDITIVSIHLARNDHHELIDAKSWLDEHHRYRA